MQPRVERSDGTGLTFWYYSTRVAEASASCRYRIVHLAEILRGVAVVTGRRLPRRALKPALVVLRPNVDAGLAQALERPRRQGIRLVADFDDLLFDCPPDDYPPILNGRPRAAQERRLREYARALHCFDAFTVSTEPLAERLRRLCPHAPVHVVPNGISTRWVHQGELLYRAWQPGMPKVIRYVSGSPSHDRDFETISAVLRAFLADYPTAELEIVGHLRFDRSGFPRDRVRQRAWVPFDALPELLASSWVTLAPLADSDFNRCKSSIKFLEAAAFGCPTIAAPIADVKRHEAGGVLLAERPEQWREALERLLDDDYRLRQGQLARRYVLAHATASQSLAALQTARHAWGLS